MKKPQFGRVMDVVGPAYGLTAAFVALFMMAMPLMPFVWASAEAASDSARWIVVFPALGILWVLGDIFLTEKYVKKHGRLPPDYLT